MRTISKALLAIGVVVIVGLSSLFFASQAFAGNSLASSQQKAASSYNGGRMMGSYGFGGGMMSGSYNGHMGQMMNGPSNASPFKYMWNMMSGLYGNFTSWCNHMMSRFFGS